METDQIRRRARIKEALRTTTKGETITLDELTAVYGLTSKGAFVNIRNVITDFPDPQVSGKRHFYDRHLALQALDRFERRGDAVAAAKSDRIKALLGIETGGEALLNISDLQKASALRAEMEQRMKEQGLLIPVSEVQASYSRIFEILSRPLGNLGTVLDPNGLWPMEQRDAADKAGHEILLQLHAEVKDKLAPHAVITRPNRATKARKPAARSDAVEDGRKGRPGNPKPARHSPARKGRVDKPVE